MIETPTLKRFAVRQTDKREIPRVTFGLEEAVNAFMQHEYVVINGQLTEQEDGSFDYEANSTDGTIVRAKVKEVQDANSLYEILVDDTSFGLVEARLYSPEDTFARYLGLPTILAQWVSAKVDPDKEVKENVQIKQNGSVEVTLPHNGVYKVADVSELATGSSTRVYKVTPTRYMDLVR